MFRLMTAKPPDDDDDYSEGYDQFNQTVEEIAKEKTKGEDE